ncbi:hypothetical protein Y600_5910 [Burkholderia pseudomallei MSHR3709]|nr:hypothetical protein Y600_5910 [Burkholderia pseudomallei MSHR3709]
MATQREIVAQARFQIFDERTAARRVGHGLADARRAVAAGPHRSP